MDGTIHELVSDGDLILVLENPNAPFAPWDPAFEANGAVVDVSLVPQLDPSSAELQTQVSQESTNQDENPMAEVGDGIESGQNNGNSHDQSDEIQDLWPEDSDLESAPDIRYRCSSSHLIQASAYFKSSLCGPWKQSSGTDHSCREIKADGWDSEALLITLNVIHGRYRKVPRQLDVEMLARIATIADYYQFHEALELAVERWLEAHEAAEVATGRNFLLWLTVACIFPSLHEDNHIFDELLEKLFLKAWKNSNGPLQTLDLPIPSIVVDTINKVRNVAIGDLIAGLQEMINNFLPCRARGVKLCDDHNCSRLEYGALTESLHRLGFLTDAPKPPYIGQSYATISARIKSIDVPRECSSGLPRIITGSAVFGSHKIHRSIYDHIALFLTHLDNQHECSDSELLKAVRKLFPQVYDLVHE